MGKLTVKKHLGRRQRVAVSGRLLVCAPLTTRFPPLTRKRAMTATRRGPALPTGGYPVVDHDLSSSGMPRPESHSSHSADFRECEPGQKYVTVLKASIFRISRRKYPRCATGFRGSGGDGGGRAGRSGPVRPASPEAARRAEDRWPGRPMSPGADAGPWPRRQKTHLRILFLSSGTELSADRSVFTPTAWRPILGGGVQSHMGYHGNRGQRMAMQCQAMQCHVAFYAIARNNSATVGKSGRPHA